MNLFLVFIFTFFILAAEVVIGGSGSDQKLEKSDKYPGGTVHTFSDGLRLLELAPGTDLSHPAFNVSHLISLRLQGATVASLPKIPGVPEAADGPVYLPNPSFGKWVCVTHSTSPPIQNHLNNAYDIMALGSTWCCQIEDGCTVMNTDGPASAALCRAAIWVNKLCIPCWRAGSAVQQLVSYCQKGGKMCGNIVVGQGGPPYELHVLAT